MTWLVVGLGNPGPSYAAHRHNVGAMVVAELARRAGEGFTSARGMRAEVVTTRVGTAGVGVPTAGAQRLVLCRTRTYMNESGIGVGKVAAFHDIAPDHVVVVHDELDIDFAALRIKLGGGDNGHNGLKSIRAHLGTGDYYRIRVGIGRPPGRQDPAAYVLSDFSAVQRKELPMVIDRAADAVETLVTDGLTATQNRFNG
ncbi:aminoacyl-tRNA hydrolase [Microlunatus sp. Y2014]|uniref:aminoacyl-tRNA hydrolase n=1 Tax=Microlunatus sp. Y2014 TaxID=3418488 RepID=UPI003DA72F50